MIVERKSHCTKKMVSDEMAVFIGLGANLGQREANLRRAAWAISRLPGVSWNPVNGTSSLYETSPVGGTVGQAFFLNSVLRISTELSPLGLLTELQSIETGLGRTRDLHWGPRVIDLDILHWDGLVLNSSELILPHALLHERLFALEPLAEICPGGVHPLLNRSFHELAGLLRTRSSDASVDLMANPNWVVQPVDAALGATPAIALCAG